MATLSHLLLLFSLLSLSSSAATTTSPLSLSPILSSLGFHDLAAAASSFPTTWHGPVTVFAPTPTSLHTCPSCSLPHLLQEHTLPGLFPLPYLRSLLSGTRIETLAPGRCLTLTHSATSPPKIFVSGVEITHPNLLSNTLVIVHVISGYLSHLSPDSCSLERMTSLSFPPNHPHPRGTLPPPSSLIMRLMLKDAILRLRLSGYSILSIALKLKSAELEDLESLTVFALNDVAIFSSGGHAYVTDFKFHVVPNRLILAGDLVHLQPGTVLPTMQEGKQLVVTSSSSGGGGVTGGGGTPARVNYVKVSSPDLLFNLKIAIHGVSMPIPHVNVTAAIEVSKNERSGYGDGSSSALAGDAGVPYSVAPTKPGIKWTAEIEDHHGL